MFANLVILTRQNGLAMIPWLTRNGSCGLIGASLLAATAVTAQDASGSQPICADRPTKANGPCTVDVGHFQVEADFVNATFMNVSGASSDTWLLCNPTLRYGLTPKLDIEVNFDPLETCEQATEKARATAKQVSAISTSG